MKGHIRKRGNRWSIVVDAGVHPETGKRRQKWYSARTKRLAERRLVEVLAELNKGSPAPEPAKMRLGEYLRLWLRDYVEDGVRARTGDGYRTIVNRHLIPKLGAVRLGELTAAHIQEYQAKALREGRVDGTGGLSPQTVTHHRTVLAETLNQAVTWGLVSRNVAQGVRSPRVRRRDPRFLTISEIERLLSAARDTPYHDAIHLALYSGLRRSELCGLRWQDVDLDRRELSVAQTMVRLLGGRGIVLEEPKNDYSRRSIKLSEAPVQVLREREMERDKVSPDDLVMDLLPDTLSHRFTQITEGVGLDVSLHDLRHTHASLLIRAGVPMKVVQERLGHASILTTMDLYAHIMPGMQEDAAEKLGEALAPIERLQKVCISADARAPIESIDSTRP